MEAPPPEPAGTSPVAAAPVLISTHSQVHTQTPSQAQTQTDDPSPIIPEERESSDLADVEVSSTPSAYRAAGRIPRAGLSHSFRKMKAFLFRRPSTPEQRSKLHPDSLNGSPDR